MAQAYVAHHVHSAIAVTGMPPRDFWAITSYTTRRHSFGNSLSAMTRTALLLLLCALIAPPALAFHDHLSPEQVRDAYFIGRDQNHRDAFFANYAHSPQLPDTGPDVASIEFRTPYEQVAIRARDNQWRNYFPPDAEKDYEGHPAEVIVCVLIYETPTFYFAATNAQPDTGGFKFHISQGGHSINYATVTVDDTLPVGAGSNGSGGFNGMDIHLHFDSSQFKSDAPVTVDVLAPNGQTYSTTFDLAALK